MTAQLGDLTCGQASNDPWSSSLVNTGDRSQVELLGVLELKEAESSSILFDLITVIFEVL